MDTLTRPLPPSTRRLHPGIADRREGGAGARGIWHAGHGALAVVASLLAIFAAVLASGCSDSPPATPPPASSAKEISAFAFLSAQNSGLAADVTAPINDTTVTATVPAGTNITALVATFSTTGASVAVGDVAQVSGKTHNDFTRPVIYHVTAADHTTKDYQVTITVAPSSAKDLTALSFRSTQNAVLSTDVIGVITGSTVTATAPFGANITALVATFSTTGASVTVGGTAQTSGTTPNNFTSPVIYHVTAADGSTKDYTVTVTVGDGSAKDLVAMSFRSTDNPGLSADVIATVSGTTITAAVPYGMSLRTLVAAFSITGASVTVGGTPQVSGVTVNDFTNPITYRVVAADSSTKDYIVTVTVAAAQKDLTDFSFRYAQNQGLPDDVFAMIKGTDVTAAVPYGTQISGLIAEFSITGTSVTVGGTAQTSGVTRNDFTSPVIYSVMGADGTTQDYTVTVTILTYVPTSRADLAR
jgi:hypothetical protein